MSRGSANNGERVEPARARGGYEAYFSADEPSVDHTTMNNAPPPPTSQRSEPVIGAPPQSPPPPEEHAVGMVDAGVIAGSPQEVSAQRYAASGGNDHTDSPTHAGELAHRDGVRRLADGIDHQRSVTPGVEVLPATLTSMDLLAEISAANRARLRSTSGVRGALNKVGFNLGLSPTEQRTEERRARIRRRLTNTYQIAVVSVKGGVGRTTTVATLGSTFADVRPDRVVAVDANPDFGDLAARTSPHPYGLTLRDLVESENVDAFSAVQFFASVNAADLAVLASPWTTEATQAMSGREYASAAEILSRHYNLLLVDCGTGVLDSVTGTVLRMSDAIVVVTAATVGGVKGAVATLNWLNSHGLQHLIAQSAIAIVQHQRAKPVVEIGAIEELFATARRPTYVLPYDPHLAEGGEIDLRLLDGETVLAFEELAAGLADGFPGYRPGSAGASGGRT